MATSGFHLTKPTEISDYTSAGTYEYCLPLGVTVVDLIVRRNGVTRQMTATPLSLSHHIQTKIFIAQGTPPLTLIQKK